MVTAIIMRYQVRLKQNNAMHNLIKSPRKFLFNLCLGIALCLTSIPVLAADKITFFDPPFGEFDILIKDLAIFANEGKITPRFAYYANRLSSEELKKVRQALKISLPLNEINVYKFLNSYIGKETINQLIKVINSPSDESRPFLEGALIEAASQPQGLTVINILQKYGSDSAIPVNIPLNLTAVKNTISYVDELINATEKIASWLKKNNNSLVPLPINPPISALDKAGSVTFVKHSFTINRPNKHRILAVVYLPENLQKPAPVVVIAPGFNSDISSLTYVAEHLASYGFGVAALNFPDTDQQRITEYLEGVDNLSQPNAWLEQPKDITLLLDTIEKKAQSNSSWRGKLDLNNVGVLGQSLGGYTSLAIGGSQIDWNHLVQACQSLKNPDLIFLNSALLWQCRGVNGPVPDGNLQDRRVKAVIAINPVSSPIFGKKGLSQMKVPVMLFAGSNDKFAPAILEQIQPFTELTQSDKYLLFLKGGTHLSFLTGGGNFDFSLQILSPGADPSLARSYLKSLSLAFFQTYLNQESSYKTYLNESSVKAMSQPSLPIYLLRTLTEEQLQQVTQAGN